MDDIKLALLGDREAAKRLMVMERINKMEETGDGLG